ncbi:MAG: hypothetical protein KF834_06800 [Burkholderiales bacterium]|nr:hypothetical protein [Burkholderiales bacterium]
MQKSARTIPVLSALVALGGCVAVPVAPAYHEPGPVMIYGPAPAYYGPPIRFDYYRFGVYGGRHGYHHHPYRGHGGRRGHR